MASLFLGIVGGFFAVWCVEEWKKHKQKQYEAQLAEAREPKPKRGRPRKSKTDGEQANG